MRWLTEQFIAHPEIAGLLALGGPQRPVRTSAADPHGERYEQAGRSLAAIGRPHVEEEQKAQQGG
ncbi:hypothetical protein ACI782_14385 [Geodermatophilus sp. SYSU D00703]